MDVSFAERLIAYQSNVLPVLLEKLSQQLHVSTNALTALEIGYMLRNNCWVFPERDEFGDVIGLSLRQWNGQKYMVPGSKRGLTYVPHVHHSSINPDTYQAGPHNWTRTSEDLPCPICGKPDWCMVSSEAPEDPKAVLCCRVQHGANRRIGDAGYLHILKVEGDLPHAGSVLLPSEHPLVIVEGATDVAAAMDISLVAIGRPSNLGCLDRLTQLVAGREVVIIGENDAGAGTEGMERAFEVLRPHAKEITKLLPLEGVKDLRQWISQGLTLEQFLSIARQAIGSPHEDKILRSIAPLDLARQWLKATYYQDDMFTLRVFHGSWYAYTGKGYKEIERDILRQQLYRFFDGKQFKKDLAQGFNILNYDPTRHKVDEIIDALLAFCPITDAEIPCWLDKKTKRSDPKQILSFPNGYLDISGYAKRNEAFELQKPDPHFFSLACYPYNFDPDATCSNWIRFLNELFTDDPLKITLLQEWFGYNLIPDNSHEKFMMFLGPTRAGKGTILDVLACILGEDQVLATSFRDYTRRFAIFPFLGKLAAIIGDVSVGTNYDATEALNLLKRITGNDVITIERKGRDITQTCIKLYARFTMAANTMPRLPDFARTIESRMLVIQFMTSFMGREDITLKNRLKREAAGILIWALEGLQRLRKNGDFTLPATHHQVLRRVGGEINPLMEFVDDNCLIGKDFSMPTVNLYGCWDQWTKANGEHSHTKRWLISSLGSLYPGCICRRGTVNGRRVSIMHGIKLQTDAAREMGL